jgi:hypothetical protein
MDCRECHGRGVELVDCDHNDLAVTQSWPSGQRRFHTLGWPASMAGNCPFQQSSHRYSTCHKRNACRRPRTSAHATSDIDTRYGHPTPSRPGSSDRNVIPNQPCGFDFRYSLGLRIAPPMGLRDGPRRCSAGRYRRLRRRYTMGYDHPTLFRRWRVKANVSERTR